MRTLVNCRLRTWDGGMVINNMANNMRWLVFINRNSSWLMTWLTQKLIGRDNESDKYDKQKLLQQLSTIWLILLRQSTFIFKWLAMHHHQRLSLSNILGWHDPSHYVSAIDTTYFSGTSPSSRINKSNYNRPYGGPWCAPESMLGFRWI